MSDLAQSLVMHSRRKLPFSLFSVWPLLFFIHRVLVAFSLSAAATRMWAMVCLRTDHKGRHIANYKFLEVLSMSKALSDLPAQGRMQCRHAALYQYFFRHSPLREADCAFAGQPGQVKEYIGSKDVAIVARYSSCGRQKRNGKLGDCIEKFSLSGREDEFYSKIATGKLNLRNFSVPQIYSVQRVGGFSRTTMEYVEGQRVNKRYLRENVKSIAMAAAEVNGLFAILNEASAKNEILNTIKTMEREAKVSGNPNDIKIHEIIQQTSSPITRFVKNIPLLFSHGDLHAGNMLLSSLVSMESSSELFIIDWGAAGYSFPGTDLYVYAQRFPDDEHILVQSASLYKRQLESLGIQVEVSDVILGAMLYAFLKLGQRALRDRHAGTHLSAYQVGENLRRRLLPVGAGHRENG